MRSGPSSVSAHTVGERLAKARLRSIEDLNLEIASVSGAS